MLYEVITRFLQHAYRMTERVVREFLVYIGWMQESSASKSEATAVIGVGSYLLAGSVAESA